MQSLITRALYFCTLAATGSAFAMADVTSDAIKVMPALQAISILKNSNVVAFAPNYETTLDESQIFLVQHGKKSFYLNAVGLFDREGTKYPSWKCGIVATSKNLSSYSGMVTLGSGDRAWDCEGTEAIWVGDYNKDKVLDVIVVVEGKAPSGDVFVMSVVMHMEKDSLRLFVDEEATHSLEVARAKTVKAALRVLRNSQQK